MWPYEEGLLVVLHDAHIASAPSSLHLPQHGGQPAAATNVMSADSDSVHLAVLGRRLQAKDVEEEEVLDHEAIAGRPWYDMSRRSATDAGPSVDCVRELEANCIFQSPSAPHDPRA